MLTPLDSTTGPVPGVVTSNGTASPPFTANLQAVAPSLLLFGASQYIVATHEDGSSIRPASLYPGLSTPAKPNEAFVVYAVGFGLALYGHRQRLIYAIAALVSGMPDRNQRSSGGIRWTNGSPGLYQVNTCAHSVSSTPFGDLITVDQ